MANSWEGILIKERRLTWLGYKEMHNNRFAVLLQLLSKAILVVVFLVFEDTDSVMFPNLFFRHYGLAIIEYFLQLNLRS